MDVASIARRVDALTILTAPLAGKKWALLICAGGLALIAVLFIFQSFYRQGLLVQAATGGKKKFSFAATLSALLDAAAKIGKNILILLPVAVCMFAVLLLACGVFKTVSGINEFVEREKRMQELTVAIKYLEQSDKVLNVRVLQVANGDTTLRLDYTAKDSDTNVPPVEWRKEIMVRGTDIYFDCVVLNFSYSEIAAGREKNIAIPYRVFSNAVPADEGIYLHEDAYNIPEEDDFGFIPPVYRERLRQLLTDEEFARDMGVRSVNGSAVHRAVLGGERFQVVIEQSGGVNLR